ncbi:MAG: FkbM family methyltransferase [Elusimicrobia bacterium]|nr:FkbM family methyltransferase [Elusimicrobiota bacterium]
MSINPEPLLGSLLEALPEIHRHHAKDSRIYGLLEKWARREARRLFSRPQGEAVALPPLGSLILPYCRMGAIDSVDIMGLDEWVLFSFYWVNRGRYKRALDLGANIGLHSIIMDKCGYAVSAYEPDPAHFELLRRNLGLNSCGRVKPIQAAVSAREGTGEFIRVLGNTTSSHIAGSKEKPYGELERFAVRLEAFLPLMLSHDLVKMDVEGHEKELILSTQEEHWANTDVLMEVQSPANAGAVFGHLSRLRVNMFSQKTNWRPVKRRDDMPDSYKEGSLYVSRKDRMPWD